MWAGRTYAADKVRVGIFEDNNSKAVKSIERTLTESGMEPRIVTRKDMEAGKIYDCDVLFFGGGWGAYFWLKMEGSMHVVEFVEQRGGGVVFSMFRCGTVARSMIRPMFPDVADAYNKVNSRGLIVKDAAHPVMEGLPGRYLLPFWDHAVLRLGPQGHALAVNTGGEAIIACGQAGAGRAVFIGPWLGVDESGQDAYPMPEHDRTLLLNSVRWAAAAQMRNRTNSTALSEATQLKVLRREALMDWTHNARGQSYTPGLLTQARNRCEQELDDLGFRLDRYANCPSNQPEAAASLQAARNTLAGLRAGLESNCNQAVSSKVAEIGRMSIEDMRKDPLYNGGVNRKEQLAEWRQRLLPPQDLAAITEQTRKLEAQLEPERRAQLAALAAAARTRDAALEPGLLHDLEASNSQVRASAALELGRIGDDAHGAPAALIKALADPEYAVRRNAIYALAWMQSPAAVPPLMDLLAKSADTRTRRRSAQALGQIGDARAVDILVKAAADSDPHVRQNSVLALGWIGDKKAVEPLINVARNAAAETGGDRQVLICAIRSLGYIGDPAARPLLEGLKVPPLAHYHSKVEIDVAAEAMALIAAGGRGKSGVAQLEGMRDENDFHWLSGRYNALCGRYTMWRSEPQDPGVMLDYVAASGASGTVEFNTVDSLKKRQPDIDPDRHFERASELGLKIVMQMPTMPIFADKVLFERELMRLAGHPSFGGFWLEENVSLDGLGHGRDSDRQFRNFLSARYSAAELAALGIDDIGKVAVPQPDGPAAIWSTYNKDGVRTNRVVFAEYLEFVADLGVEHWGEIKEFAAGLRKGGAMTFSMSQRYGKGGSTFISGYPRINLLLDAGGPQSYGAHSSMNNFNLDMHVDGEPRPALGEFYAHQEDTPGRVERGFASSFLYGQCFFNWWWGHIFKHAPDNTGGSSVYDPGRWEAAMRQFGKGKALSEYMAPRATRGAGLITQLYSGRTTTLTYGDGCVDGYGGYGKIKSPSGYVFRYTQNQEALWESLVRSHLPVEMTWLETQSPEKLAGFKVAVLADAVSLDTKEVTMIREWVRNGGTLIATASSSLHDRWDREQKNYSLADVFGVDYERTEGNPSLVYVERDLKPDSGITKIRITAPEYLEKMRGAVDAEYEKAIGYDVVKPTTGKVIGVWEDGRPAVVENTYGKGHVIFIGARYPALSHLTLDWTVDDLYKVFWPGMRELLSACVERGVALAGAELPVQVKNCPQTVDVALKRQEQHGRWMVHLLNMSAKTPVVKGVEVTVTIPESREVKAVYYAYPDKEPVVFAEAPRKAGKAITFTVRPFDVHEMVVVEYKKSKAEE